MKTSIIVVNFNGEKIIEACLNNLLQSTYKDYEIIVVDNNSTDKSIEILNKYIYKIKLIRLKENKGFTGGNIEGLKYAAGEIIVLVNNDVEVDAFWLEKLIKPIIDSKDIGICASKMIVYGTNTIDSAGDGCTTTARGYKLGEGKLQSEFMKSKYVFGACGGAVAYRRKMLNEIGFFDDDFFLIHEDTDLNFRAQLAGWKCYFVYDAIVYHKVRTTIGTMSNLAIYYSVRNAEYVWLKNMPLLLMIKYLHHKIIQEILTLLFFCIKKKKYKIYLKAKIDFIINIPKLLKKRKMVQKLREVPTNHIDKALSSIFSKEVFELKRKKIFESKVRW